MQNSTSLLKCLAVAFGIGAIALSSGLAYADESADIMARYQTHESLLGYPLDPQGAVAPRLKNVHDFRQALRIKSYVYGDVTPAEADKLAAKFKEQGYNLILAEGNRYLFNDGDEKLPIALKSPVFDQLVANTKIMADACHRHGLRFFHHLTCTMVSPHLLEKHPGWAAIDIATGQSPENGYGTRNTCINNDEFMNAFFTRLDRLQRESGADGIMQDEIQFFAPTLCGCTGCREKFKAATGITMPKDTSTSWFTPNNPEYIKWIDWRRASVVRNDQRLRALMKKYNKDNTIITYLCNNTTGYSYYSAGLAIEDFPKYADSVGYECEPPDYLYQFYWPHMAMEMRYLRAVAENIDTAPWTLFYNRTRADFTWNWMLAMSQGHRVWWETSDPGTEAAAQPLIAWEARHQNLMMNLHVDANIGIHYASNTRNKYPLNTERSWMHGYTSTANALMDAHVPYEAIVEENMKAADLKKRVKTLLLFDATNLSDQTAAELRQFVKEGGTLIASAGTSLYTEARMKRPNFALADLFGFNYDSEIEKGDVLRIPAANPVTGDVQGDLPHPDGFVAVKNIQPGVQQFGEMIAADGKKYPGILTRDYGRGKVVYFTGHPEYKYLYYYYNENEIRPEKFWKDNRNPQYGRLLANVARYANNDVPMRVENVPHGLLVEPYRHQQGQTRGIQVHLLNFLGGRIKEGVVPLVNNISFPDVKVNLPDPSKPITIAVKEPGIKQVYLLSPDFDEVVQLPFKKQGGETVVDVPKLYRYSILYFNQGSNAEFRKLAGGRFANSIPAAKPLNMEVKQPLVGTYDPKAVVAFAGTPLLAGGAQITAYKGEQGAAAYGSQSDVTTLTATLDVPAGITNPVLEIGAMDDNQPTSRANIEIKLNGKSIFTGKTDYPDDVWAVHKFPIKAEDVVAGKNTVEIKNLGEGPRGNTPWFMVNFVRIKPGA